MPQFSIFSNAIAKELDRLEILSKSKNKTVTFFRSNVESDDLWSAYLSAYTPEENPIFRTKTEYDCSCCRQFIRNVGGLLYSDDNGQTVKSIWDVRVDNAMFQRVANSLRDTNLLAGIKSPFLHYEKKVGVEKTHEQRDDHVHTWNHFYGSLPSVCVTSSDRVATEIGDFTSSFQVLKRAVEEITDDAIATVLELIEQNSIYRGKEFKASVDQLRKTKKEYLSAPIQALYLWDKVVKRDTNVRVRNSVIGTLLVDISEGVDLDRAVAAYESKVAPENYRRPTAVVTKSMIENAQKFVVANGLESALYRRHATIDDITVNNVLFADRSVLQQKGIFDTLKDSAGDKLPSLDKIEEIGIHDFLDKVMPNAKGIELYFDSKHVNNLFSLIAPVYSDAKSILRWNNNFSWSYNGDVTDSVKERVKAAGGNIEGQLRVSLSWFNYDDLDLSVIEPSNKSIYFGNKRGLSGGILDIDMNAGSGKTREAVENIYWKTIDGMYNGNYKVVVDNFSKRENKDFGFILEVELDGQIYQYHHKQAYNSKQVFLEFSYNKRHGISFGNGFDKFTQGSSYGGVVIDKWNMTSGKFHKVDAIMLSPNHWDDNNVGNKHYMFVLNDAKNDAPCRGIYNEFLKADTNEYRKVFEMLGSQLMVEPNKQQLSGLGFSETKKDAIIVRVTGSFSRLLKINIG